MTCVHHSPEAMREFRKWNGLLTDHQESKLLAATVTKDGNEWCILSGPDLAADRAGFGQTITDAMKDYISGYALNKIAS